MKKKDLLIGLCVIIVLGVVGVICFFNRTNSDAIKFKEEYEALNGTVRESDGAKYNDVSIPKDNPIKYIDSKEALKILDNEDAIIYVGAEWCPWCRNAVPVLFDVADEFDVKTIYYLNLDDEKSNFEVKNGEAVKTVDGSEDYYKLLDKLSDRLTDYTLRDEDGNVVNTGEKRIYMPYVFGVKNGRVVSDHVGTVSLTDGQTKYSALSDEQVKELNGIYTELFSKVYDVNHNGTCDIGEVCD